VQRHVEPTRVDKPVPDVLVEAAAAR
jgi:hypothetical protein